MNNNNQEPLKYKYEQVEVGVPIFMGDVMAADDHDDVTKSVKSCKNKEETNVHIRSEKDKIHDRQTGHESNQKITEEVEAGH